METTHSLFIESFSSSWLVNLKPDDPSHKESTFIEMVRNISFSKRILENFPSQKFDFPILNSSSTIIHADELISNGFVVPLFIKPLMKENIVSLNFESATNILSSSIMEKKILPTSTIQCSSLKRCGKSSKDFLHKYLRFFRPLCRKLRGRSAGARIEAVGERDREKEIWVGSNYSSPRTSVDYYDGNFRSSCDSESSIYEAVLHCKNSNGK